MQVYRGMDIGTDKLPEAQRMVPHRLIDVCDPGQPFSAQQFQCAARQAFRELEDSGKPAVLCGGTGLYVQAALEDMRFPKGDQLDNPVRQRWEAYCKKHGSQELWNQLAARDMRSAALVHPNNVKRVIRALEMHEEGVSYADQSANMKSLPEVVPSVRFGLMRDRETLYRRIEARVDAMFEAGLVEEVSRLLDAGLRQALTANQAIGYKEVVACLDGECSLADAAEAMKMATRRYAKRQISWFKRDRRIIWLDADLLATEDMASIIKKEFNTRLQGKQGTPNAL